MISVKELMTSEVNISLDGKHWEPAIPMHSGRSTRLRDAWAVLCGSAVAIRQTTKDDITKHGEPK